MAGTRTVPPENPADELRKRMADMSKRPNILFLMTDQQRHAELVDVVPTLLEVAGREPPEWLPGLSLLSDASRGASFAEMHGRGYEQYQGAPAAMLRTDRWKLILSLPRHLGEAREHMDSRTATTILRWLACAAK